MAGELQHDSGRSNPSLAEMIFGEHDLILYIDTGDNENLIYSGALCNIS